MNKPTPTIVRDASARSSRLRLASAPSRSDPVEHHAQIVCGHLGDCRNRESDGLRDRCDRFEVSQTPGRVAIAKASVERLVARGRCEAFAFVWAIEIERRVGGRIAAAPLINPSVVSHDEMWTMLMQMIPSAEAIGQGDCEASKTHIRDACGLHPCRDTLQRARVSIGRLENENSGDFSQNERRARPSRLRFRG